LLSKSRARYQTFTWGEGLIDETLDPDGAALTTTYIYYSDGHLQQVVHPDGSWQYYQYDVQGRKTVMYSSFLNQSPTTNPTLCRLTQYSYSGVAPGDDGTLEPYRPRQIVEKLLSREIGRSYLVLLSGQEQAIQCQTAGAAWNAADNSITITTKYTSGLFSNEVQSIKRPDGTMQFFEYTTNSTGTMRTNTVYRGQPNAQQTAIVNGTKTVTVLGTAGETISQTTIDIGSGITIQSETHSNFDEFRRAQRIDYLDGTYELKTYGCCGLELATDRQGIQTSYGYDSIKRLVSTTRDGISAINSIRPQ
jgi:YD repeat-containing protein